MSASVYNIIWADDEYLSLKEDSEIRKFFDLYKIEVLDWVPTSEDLKKSLDRFRDKVDAVVVDGNFPKSMVDYVEPNDISGLIHTITFIDLFNVKRDIPFFLYTSKKVFLQEFCQNKELDYFLSVERVIQKGEIEKLAKLIVYEVDRIHSIEHMVNTRFQPLINKVKKVDEKGAELLHQFLLDEARDITFERTELMFNDLRNIIEKVVLSLCKEYEIIPEEVKTLNNFKHYWCGKLDKIEWYGPTQCPIVIKGNPIMPKVISSQLWGYIDIIQDGSHSTEELRLNIREYVINTKRTYLFRTCLYQTLDILRWLDNTIKDINEGKLRTPLYKDKY